MCKRFSLILVLALALGLLCVFLSAEAETETRVFQLGTSIYTIEIPVSFVEGEKTEEGISQGMVAYMHSDETSLDFDVYQFPKKGLPDSLAVYCEGEAAHSQAFEVKTGEEINGIATAWYRAKETFEGQEYTTLNYLFDGGDQYVEITFWLDGETAEEEVQTMLSTLASTQSSADQPALGMVGGWAPAADPTITDEIKALLDKATEGLDGVAYDPITYLGSQVVAGTNHAILCKATVLNLNAIPTWKIVYIYEDLQGNVSVMNIADFDVGSLCTYGAK